MLLHASASHPPELQAECACNRREPMQSTKDNKSGSLQSILSRRNLLMGAGALAAATSVPEALGQTIPPTGAPFGTIWLYISTYTSATPPTSAFGNNGQ